MCRLYGFRAVEPTKVECTLVHAQNALLIQSRTDLRGKAHADGWGVAFYEDGLPTIERRETPAYQDVHFSVAAERVYARTVIAHVRRATVGGPSLVNTHPFSHGCWLFTHNGTVRGFDAIRDQLQRQTDDCLLAEGRGTTDSETVFYWLLSRFREVGLDPSRPCSDLPRLVELIQEGTRELDAMSRGTGAQKPPRLNFMLTDGTVLVASRWNQTLHWVHRDGIHDCEICGIPHVHHQPGADYRAVVVASEPISDEQWEEVPNRSMVAVDGDVGVELHPI